MEIARNWVDVNKNSKFGNASTTPCAPDEKPYIQYYKARKTSKCRMCGAKAAIVIHILSECRKLT